MDQLYANVDVAGEIKARLPEQLQPLAAPAAGPLQNAAIAAAQRARADARVQEIWKQSNRAADQSFIDIVNGRKGAGQSGNGKEPQIVARFRERLAELGIPEDKSAVLAWTNALVDRLNGRKGSDRPLVAGFCTCSAQPPWSATTAPARRATPFARWTARSRTLPSGRGGQRS